MSATSGIPAPPRILLDSFFSSSQDLTGITLYTREDDVQFPTPKSPDDSKPYVTLTFAQSVDAKIAGKGGKQLALSGKESLIMTHWMRTMHDAIVVGIGTALNDDPQLNVRHLPPLPGGHPYRYHLPRPVVLDSSLRLPVYSKLLRNFREGRGRRPWVIGTRPSEADLPAWQARKFALESGGAKVIEVDGENGKIHIPILLKTLRTLGIRSLMVEGGARVIQSFLAESTHNDSTRVIDTVIVTVAPIFVGDDGVGYGTNVSSSAVSELEHIRTELFGRDVVFALKFTKQTRP